MYDKYLNLNKKTLTLSNTFFSFIWLIYHRPDLFSWIWLTFVDLAYFDGFFTKEIGSVLANDLQTPPLLPQKVPILILFLTYVSDDFKTKNKKFEGKKN